MRPSDASDNPFGEWLQAFDPQRAWKLLPLVGLALLALGALPTSYYTVQPEGQAVVKRFGKVVAITGPGLHFRLPFLIDRVHFVPTERVLKEEFGFRTERPGVRTTYQSKKHFRDESLMLTGDLNVIDVEWVVQYRISDPDKFLHRATDPVRTIRDVSEAVMRRIVGSRVGSNVLTEGRVEISNTAEQEMQEILGHLDIGVRVLTVEMQDVTPPDKVKPAFNEVNEAEQQREGMINEAERRRNQVIPRAQGEALQTVEEARGYAAERVNRAKGDASRFSAILAEYRNAPHVTRRRLYLEVLDDVLPDLGGIYVVEGGGASPLPLLDLTHPNRRGGVRE